MTDNQSVRLTDVDLDLLAEYIQFDAGATARLTEALGDDAREVRQEAARALETIVEQDSTLLAGTAAVEELSRLAADAEADHGTPYLLSLARIARSEPRLVANTGAVDTLIGGIDRRSESERLSGAATAELADAIATLAEYNPAIITAAEWTTLLRVARDADSTASEMAATVIEGIAKSQPEALTDSDCVDELATILEEGPVHSRRAATYGLAGAIYANDIAGDDRERRVAPTGDGDTEQGHETGEIQRGLPALVAALEDSDADVRAAAFDSIGRLAKADPDRMAEAIPFESLVNALEADDVMVQTVAIDAVGGLVPTAPDEFAELEVIDRIQAAMLAQPAVRASAITALGRIVRADPGEFGTPALVETLVDAMDDVEPAPRREALMAIHRLIQADPDLVADTDAITNVIAALRDDDEQVQETAIATILSVSETAPALLEGTGFVQSVLGILFESDARLQLPALNVMHVVAVEAPELLVGTGAIPELLHITTTAAFDDQVRKQAGNALAALAGSNEALLDQHDVITTLVELTDGIEVDEQVLSGATGEDPGDSIPEPENGVDDQAQLRAPDELNAAEQVSAPEEGTADEQVSASEEVNVEGQVKAADTGSSEQEQATPSHVEGQVPASTPDTEPTPGSEESDATDAQIALHTLGMIGMHHPDGLAAAGGFRAIERALRANDRSVREAGASAAATIGDRQGEWLVREHLLEVVLESLQTDVSNIWRQSAKAIGGIGEAAPEAISAVSPSPVPFLAVNLDAHAPDTRRAAARALRRIAAGNPESIADRRIVNALATRFGDSDTMTRWQMINALGELVDDHPDVLAMPAVARGVVGAIDDDMEDVQVAAVAVLAAVARSDPERFEGLPVEEKLQAVAASGHPEAQEPAREALQTLRESVPELLENGE